MASNTTSAAARDISDEEFQEALDKLCERDDLVGEIAREYRANQEDSS